MKVTGIYTLNLDAPIFVANPVTHYFEHDPIGNPQPVADCFPLIGSFPVDFSFREFSCQVTFVLGFPGNFLQRCQTMPGVEKIKISLSADSDIDPADEDKMSALKNRYLLAMWDVSRRVLDYFRYEHGFPFLRPMNAQNIAEVSWIQDGKESISATAANAIYVDAFPGLPFSKHALGSKPVRPSNLDAIQKGLQQPREYDVHEQLRSQAREAIFTENYRLAVMLLAIACEVKVKRTFFGATSITNEIFDWLSDAQKVQVSALELISQGAKRVIGVGYKEQFPAMSVALDNLFRCRNKVAHKGEHEYRDVNSQKIKVADEQALLEWWEAVDHLFNWLDASIGKA